MQNGFPQTILQVASPWAHPACATQLDRLLAGPRGYQSGYIQLRHIPGRVHQGVPKKSHVEHTVRLPPRHRRVEVSAKHRPGNRGSSQRCDLELAIYDPPPCAK